MNAPTRGLAGAAAIAGAIAFTASPVQALPPDCGTLVIDDPLTGATVGTQEGGTVDASGFTPGVPAGSIVWNFDTPIRSGCVEVTVQGVTTANVGEHDLVELFTGPDGAFSDGAQDYFLLFKVAGSVFPEYEGRLKVEMGRENEMLEVGSWSDNLAWDPTTSYTLVVQLDDAGVASFYRDDVLLEVVDYNKIAGGQLDFASLRIPNDGQYQVEAALSGVVYRDVHVYDDSPPPLGETTGDDGGETAADGADSGVDSGVDSGAGDDGGGGPTGSSSGEPTSGDSSSTGDSSIVTSGGASGLPLPGRGGDSSGCACTTSQRRQGGWAWLVVLLGLGWLGRRTQ